MLATSGVTNLPVSVQEDGDVADSDLPVMAGVCNIAITLFLFLFHTLFTYSPLRQCRNES